VTLSKSRTSVVALAACGLSAAIVLSGCGAGQISQTATQNPAVNGALAWVGNPASGIALRNVHLRAPQTADFVRPGDQAELLFVAINESTENPDRLVSITSDIGTVSVTGDAQVPAGGTLVVGTPDGTPSALDAAEGANTVEAVVRLSEPITNGLNYPFTFTFERSGQTEVTVPISAGEAPRREAAVEAGAEADTGGH
jgi:copper(I)-binding protein